MLHMVDVVQSAERWVVVPEVAGSSPVVHPLAVRIDGMVQLDSTLVS